LDCDSIPDILKSPDIRLMLIPMQTTIELSKEDLKFSAGHYTIFSPTHREKLHGHNFNVHAAFTASVDENGIAFDYDIYKTKLKQLCKGLSETFLIAASSPYQHITEEGDLLFVHFHDEKIPFLRKDVTLLPMSNITVEELSRWFIEQLIAESDFDSYDIQLIRVKVFSAPGQSGSAKWHRGIGLI
jgi:6-pyruvoyltetrahydropterin/6-carboxytetrahydropterin synthase